MKSFCFHIIGFDGMTICQYEVLAFTPPFFWMKNWNVSNSAWYDWRPHAYFVDSLTNVSIILFKRNDTRMEFCCSNTFSLMKCKFLEECSRMICESVPIEAKFYIDCKHSKNHKIFGSLKCKYKYAVKRSAYHYIYVWYDKGQKSRKCESCKTDISRQEWQTLLSWYQLTSDKPFWN